MKNQYFKTLGSALIVGLFLLFAFGSGSENKPKEKVVKAEFSSCKEVIDYIGGYDSQLGIIYSSLDDLQKLWNVQDVKIGNPYLGAGGNQMWVDVIIDKVKVNGKTPKFMFKATETGQPTSWCIGVDCN